MPVFRSTQGLSSRFIEPSDLSLWAPVLPMIPTFPTPHRRRPEASSPGAGLSDPSVFPSHTAAFFFLLVSHELFFDR